MTGHAQYGQYCDPHTGRSNLDGRSCLGSCAQRETKNSDLGTWVEVTQGSPECSGFEHLKYRLSQVEQVNHHINLTTTMLLNDHLARTRFSVASTIYDMQPHIPRQIPVTVPGNPVQPIFYSTLQTQPKLQYLNHMVSTPMTAFPYTSSQVQGIPTHPVNPYTTRPVQLQNIPPPVASYHQINREWQFINYNQRDRVAPQHQRVIIPDQVPFSRESQQNEVQCQRMTEEPLKTMIPPNVTEITNKKDDLNCSASEQNYQGENVVVISSSPILSKPLT